jgi:hypothetical protein
MEARFSKTRTLVVMESSWRVRGGRVLKLEEWRDTQRNWLSQPCHVNSRLDYPKLRGTRMATAFVSVAGDMMCLNGRPVDIE